MRLTLRRAAAVAAVSGLTQIAGCGGSAKGICEVVCECASCSDSEEEECVEDFEDLEDDAAREGCEEEYDDFAACTEEKLECEDDVVDFRRCDDELEDLGECLDEPPNLGSIADPCAQAAQICGGEGSGEEAECAGTVLCFASCIVAENACDADTLNNCLAQCDSSGPAPGGD